MFAGFPDLYFYNYDLTLCLAFVFITAEIKSMHKDMKQVKVKAHASQRTKRSKLIPGFLRMLLPPGQDACPSQGYPRPTIGTSRSNDAGGNENIKKNQ